VLAHSVAGAAIFGAVAEVACGDDTDRSVEAFDAWGGAELVGEGVRQAGSGDAQAWRVVELARALIAVPPGRLGAVPDVGLPQSWFEVPAVRSATGWNRWHDETYLSREAWAEFIDALAARDSVRGLDDADPAATELKRRAAAAGYRLEQVHVAADDPGPHAPA
jgi:hypothetical protein